jgi:hypothetical protein
VRFLTSPKVTSITGETRCYNGLEVDGVGAVGIPGGINYRFCAVCGSSVYFDMVFPPTGQRFFTIALGSFVGAVFPTPTAEFFTKFRHPWVPPIPAAVQLYDPMGADAERAWDAVARRSQPIEDNWRGRERCARGSVRQEDRRRPHRLPGAR